ncbi:MAG TPA: anhydro-N-acetylmuramic acid kinase [Rhodanobacteraceae bacterium]|nr:anhydro-N-acetylmuramic acid kinase [Rhodanobacteraceae bacterium]
MSDDALYVGLISGTSADGIDAVLARFEPRIEVLAAQTLPWPAQLRQRIVALARDSAHMTLDDFGSLDARVGDCFAEAALALLAEAGVHPTAVRAIGSHGQTLCHRPRANPPFTLQIGNPALIAERTGIDVVADFRAADVAAGGQGAPLLPVLHRVLFDAGDVTRVVLNLGGIANVSVLGAGRPMLGFDTGPASCLMDAWALRHLGTPRDDDGAWAASGQADPQLLARLLEEPYFGAPPPKSTGREQFNLDWLARHVAETAPADVQATLLMLTVRSIADAVASQAGDAGEVLACGGGLHNPVLMAALADALRPVPLRSTAELGIDPDFVEATAFAWLARERLAGRPGNVPAVTGARGPRVLGNVSLAPR